MLKRKIIIALILMFGLIGCASSVGANQEPVVVISPIVTEVGNWTYITFDHRIEGSPSQNAELIGSTIEYWEETHPDREIISMQIIYSLTSYMYEDRIDGISFYSQPTDPQE